MPGITEQIKIPLISALSDRHQMELLPLSEHRGHQHVLRNTKDTNGMLSLFTACLLWVLLCLQRFEVRVLLKIPLQDQLGSRWRSWN